jgi:hypothetical protein
MQPASLIRPRPSIHSAYDALLASRNDFARFIASLQAVGSLQMLSSRMQQPELHRD